MISDSENILNDDKLFADTIYTPKEGTEENKKRESLKSEMN